MAIRQVIASLLIVQRVADKSAFTGDTLVHGSTTPLKARRQAELTDDSGGYLTSSLSKYGTNSGEIGAGVETTVGVCREKV